MVNSVNIETKTLDRLNARCGFAQVLGVKKSGHSMVVARAHVECVAKRIQRSSLSELDNPEKQRVKRSGSHMNHGRGRYRHVN
jgi:hypothetical protein